jgi:hypothetical protein
VGGGAPTVPGMQRACSNPPDPVDRRTWLRAALATGALAVAPALRAQPRRVRLRMLLNTSISSPQAWLWLAQ